MPRTLHTVAAPVDATRTPIGRALVQHPHEPRRSHQALPLENVLFAIDNRFQLPLGKDCLSSVAATLSFSREIQFVQVVVVEEAGRPNFVVVFALQVEHRRVHCGIHPFAHEVRQGRLCEK